MTAVDSLHRGYWRPTLADCRAVAGPGTEHGFVFPLRAGRYQKAAAERHWERLLARYRRCPQ